MFLDLLSPLLVQWAAWQIRLLSYRRAAKHLSPPRTVSSNDMKSTHPFRRQIPLSHDMSSWVSERCERTSLRGANGPVLYASISYDFPLCLGFLLDEPAVQCQKWLECWCRFVDESETLIFLLNNAWEHGQIVTDNFCVVSANDTIASHRVRMQVSVRFGGGAIWRNIRNDSVAFIHSLITSHHDKSRSLWRSHP